MFLEALLVFSILWTDQEGIKKWSWKLLVKCKYSTVIVSPWTKYMTVCNGWFKIAAIFLCQQIIVEHITFLLTLTRIYASRAIVKVLGSILKKKGCSFPDKTRFNDWSLVKDIKWIHKTGFVIGSEADLFHDHQNISIGHFVVITASHNSFIIARNSFFRLFLSPTLSFDYYDIIKIHLYYYQSITKEQNVHKKFMVKNVHNVSKYISHSACLDQQLLYVGIIVIND